MEGKLQLLHIGAICQSRILVDAVLAETGKLSSAWNRDSVRGSTVVNYTKINDLERLSSAKLSKRFLLHTVLSTVGGCCAGSASVRISSKSDTLSTFFQRPRI